MEKKPAPAPLGVDHSVKFLGEVADLCVEVMGIVKSGVSFGSIPKILGLGTQLAAAVVDAKAAMPELKDLDPEEALAVGAAAYACVAKIVAAA